MLKLANLGEVPELLEWLCNPHPDGISSHVRRVAAELLGDVRTSELRVAEALRGALRSDEAELRKAPGLGGDRSSLFRGL